MALNKAQILAKWRKYQANPEVFQAPANEEVLAIAFHIIGAVNQIEEAIKAGRLDGKTPEAGKDYTTPQQTQAIFNEFKKQFVNDLTEKSTKTEKELIQKIDKAISLIENGKDGVVTDEEIRRSAEIARSLIELPNFDEEIIKALTNNGERVRDSLELLQGDEKLEQDAVKNLREDLLQLQEQIAIINMTVRSSGGGTSKNVINNVILERIADGTISSSAVNVEPPSGTANGSNTVFTVANEPKYVVVNALTYFDGGGYTYSGGTITFDIPPASGSFIRSIY